MPFTHHSHSSDYCAHASSSLESMLARARALKFHTVCLTEHAPRDHSSDLYPEEESAGMTPFDLFSAFSAFVKRAREIQREYGSGIEGTRNGCGVSGAGGDSRMRILVGCEMDYIRPSSIDLIKDLVSQHELDLVVGSVHHVHGVPIDFNKEMYEKALKLCGGSEEKLFEEYFEHQWEVIRNLKPAVVGHFDLIRLFCEDFRKPLRDYGEEVWKKVERNVEFIVGYGGLIELNSAAIRKGWDGPYPRRDVCELIMAKGGRFCLSDDAHSVAQVGLNFEKMLKYIEDLELKEVYYLEKLPMGQIAVDVLGGLKVHKITIEELKAEPFWTALAEEAKSTSSNGHSC